MVGLVAPALLEDWLRVRYFSASTDISGSGVEDYSIGDLRELLGLTVDDLDAVVLRDSASVGGERLRQAVAARYAPGRADAVVVTHGSSEAIFLAMSALVRPGDEVVVVSPGYHALVSTVAALGGLPRVWDLATPAGFVPDLDRLRAVLTPATRAVVVNFPHNPTGVTLDRDTYAQLLTLVERCGAYLLWDAAFSDLTHDAPGLPDPGSALERCVSFGTLSKAYGLPGLRVGWAIAPGPVIADMIRLRDYLTIATSPLAELIAAAVVEQADLVIGPRLAQARVNRELLLEWARDGHSLVSCPVPAGGVTAFPRIDGVADTAGLCVTLSDRHGVLVVPGACFGHPDRIRLGFGGRGERFATGLSVLQQVLSETRHGGLGRMIVDF
jgi:capreomycidine synthase